MSRSVQKQLTLPLSFSPTLTFRLSQPLSQIFPLLLDLQIQKCNIIYYKIHDICIEEVKLTNDFSKETFI